MAHITPSLLNSCYVMVNASLTKGISRASDAHTKYAKVSPSTAGAEEYPVNTVFGAMREMTGDPVISRNDLKKT